MHVVVVGCGRVGSSLAQSLTSGRSHRGRHRPPPGGLRPARGGLHRQDHRRHRLRPRPAAGGRHRAGRRRRRGDERRQLQHPHRPGGAGDLRHRAGGGPDLRPAAGDDLPAARHPHRGHRGVDHRAGPASGPPRRGGRRVGRPQRQGDARRAGGRLRLGRSGRWTSSSCRACSGSWPWVATGRPRYPRPVPCSRTATWCTWPSAGDALAKVDAHLAGPATGGH